MRRDQALSQVDRHHRRSHTARVRAVAGLIPVALAREPDAAEMAAAVEHLADARDRRQAVEDLGWVLINTKEFLFRH